MNSGMDILTLEIEGISPFGINLLEKLGLKKIQALI